MKTRYKICGCVIALVLLMTGSAGGYFHFHWNVSATAEKFTESSIELQNPNRGFYYIYGFWIKDESVDYHSPLGIKNHTVHIKHNGIIIYTIFHTVSHTNSFLSSLTISF